MRVAHGASSYSWGSGGRCKPPSGVGAEPRKKLVFGAFGSSTMPISRTKKGYIMCTTCTTCESEEGTSLNENGTYGDAKALVGTKKAHVRTKRKRHNWKRKGHMLEQKGDI